MIDIMNFPFVVLLVSFVVMWGAAQIAARSSGGMRKLDADERANFGFIIGATLTLLGLIIGFSFSMAVGRYDQRKNYEEEEANAIGTEYVRAELLPASDAQKVQALLKQYLEQRILFYQARFEYQLPPINADTARLQNELWSAVKIPALAQPTAVNALVLWGMNDVLNRQGYTQFAWWNRIPPAAWGLMVVIAVFCNVLLGLATRADKSKATFLLVLPIVVSISFLLLADLDSPRGGIILVSPQNLLSLAQSLHQ